MKTATDHITYADLVDRFGNHSARGLLRAVENLAQVKNDIVLFDHNARFQSALEALNNINFA